MKYIEKYTFKMNESSKFDTLHERIKDNYKNNKEELGLTNFYDAYELGYVIVENFDEVELSPSLPSFIIGGKVVKNSDYILYYVECTEKEDIENKEKEFKENIISKSLERLVELSKGRKFYIKNLYIFKDYGGQDGFHFTKGVRMSGYFPQ